MAGNKYLVSHEKYQIDVSVLKYQVTYIRCQVSGIKYGWWAIILLGQCVTILMMVDAFLWVGV